MKNKYIIFVSIIILLIVGISFYQYYDEYFSYARDYYLIKENCYNGKNPDLDVCEIFKYDKENIEEHFNYYIKNMDPKKAYKELDAITLTSNIIETTFFSIMQYLSPLLIIIVVIGKFHSEFSSGMFKNFFLRESHKNYLKKVMKYILKISLITPIVLIIVFLISCLVTKFNFNIADSIKDTTVYSDFKYNHFFIYGLSICLLQYIINITYAALGLIACKYNKSKIVSILFAYILFVIINLGMYLGIYDIINFISIKIFNHNLIWDAFIMNAYWFSTNTEQIITSLIVAIITTTATITITYLLYKNKEGMVLAYEKQNS